jgi:hypothetical protein
MDGSPKEMELIGGAVVAAKTATISSRLSLSETLLPLALRALARPELRQMDRLVFSRGGRREQGENDGEKPSGAVGDTDRRERAEDACTDALPLRARGFGDVDESKRSAGNSISFFFLSGRKQYSRER